jgi:protein-tyrosine phosphatase
MSTWRVVFVCMGNICRSPTAHGVFRHKVREAGLAPRIKIESAGTHNYHPGEPPDERSQEHARRRGYDLSDLRAKPLQRALIEAADLILVMDWDNLALVQAQCAEEGLSAHLPKVRRFTEFCLRLESPIVPDPYYGGAHGFEQVLDLVEDASDGLLAFARQRLAV